MSYFKHNYHIIFATKNRKPVLKKEVRPLIYSVMGQAMNDIKTKPFLINGVEDHVHILCEIPPSLSVSNLVKHIKIETTLYIKNKLKLEGYESWQESFSSFTFGNSDFENLYDYVACQEVHHKGISSENELKKLLADHDIKYDPQYFK